MHGINRPIPLLGPTLFSGDLVDALDRKAAFNGKFGTAFFLATLFLLRH
jgi:hypothetical protein